jgi:hypothetical protein
VAGIRAAKKVQDRGRIASGCARVRLPLTGSASETRTVREIRPRRSDRASRKRQRHPLRAEASKRTAGDRRALDSRHARSRTQRAASRTTSRFAAGHPTRSARCARNVSAESRDVRGAARARNSCGIAVRGRCASWASARDAAHPPWPLEGNRRNWQRRANPTECSKRQTRLQTAPNATTSVWPARLSRLLILRGWAHGS